MVFYLFLENEDDIEEVFNQKYIQNNVIFEKIKVNSVLPNCIQISPIKYDSSSYWTYKTLNSALTYALGNKKFQLLKILHREQSLL